MKTIIEVGDLLVVIRDHGIHIIQASFSNDETVNGYVISTSTEQYTVPINVWRMASQYIKPGIDDTEDQARSALALNDQGADFLRLLKTRERKHERQAF